jgi:hypothetical protein
LNGESFQPCALKIGPSRNGRHATRTSALCASPSMRDAAGYEYVLANSNQNSIEATPTIMPVPASA